MNAATAEETIAKRVYAHLQVHDITSACEEARLGFENYPHSIVLFEAYIKALAKGEDEKALWSVWNRHSATFPDSKMKREILECLAWGVIENGSHSSSPLIRVMALLGAFFGNDAKGIEILCRNMRDPNSMIRETAVKLAGNLHDAKLQDQILSILRNDKSWDVRLAAMKTAGEMKLKDAKPYLMEIVAAKNTMAEEKAVGIEALVHMMDHVDRAEIHRLATNDRAGLRLLACEVVEHLDLVQDVDLLTPLLNDHNAEVRAAALKTIGLLRVATLHGQPVKTALIRRLKDSDPHVAITAAWALTFNDTSEGKNGLEPWLQHDNREIRLVAASALAATGKYGLPLMQKVFRETKDPYVRMNIAIGLISQRVDIDKACDALYEGLSRSDRWMWEEEGGFKTLAPSTIKHDDMIPNYPESVNQIARLEVLNILAIMKYPHAQEAIRKFLQEKNWGITGMASAVLLTEGDEMAIDLVQDLLTDPDSKIRVQAALILSLWGRGEEAIAVLKEAYADADRDMKERILESFGRIAAPSTIPFLTEKLQEPYQSLRIIAAAALLQCLYN